MKKAGIPLVAAMLLATGCAGVASVGDRAPPVGFAERGEASFYASSYHGKRTASGARFDQAAFTAAHRRLPFGTRVKVTNLGNGKSVVVKVNDRGPYVRNRIVDLSRSAFSSIADTRLGVIDVRLEVVD